MTIFLIVVPSTRSVNLLDERSATLVPHRPRQATLHSEGGALVATYREQTVEIASGSKGAFENAMSPPWGWAGTAGRPSRVHW